LPYVLIEVESAFLTWAPSAFLTKITGGAIAFLKKPNEKSENGLFSFCKVISPLNIIFLTQRKEKT